jgi:uncharacterized membrane protein
MMLACGRIREQKARRLACAVLSTAFGTAGVLHQTSPGPFLAITPEWVPWAEAVIQVTGVCEIAGAADVRHQML